MASNAPQPLACLDAIEPYKGGEAKLKGFDTTLKLSSNENALGPSPAAKAAFAAAADSLHIYPEGAATALRGAIAARYGLDAGRIMTAAGSDEIFQLLARAYLAPGDEIVQSQYAFLIYRLAAQQSGAITRSAADVNYTADVDAMLALVGPKTKIVFLANPNNPTGTYLPISEVRRLHAGVPKHVLLCLDAAYAEYVTAHDYEAGMELAGQYENVIVTRTFSKIHGLAALRVGWGYGAAGVIAALHKVRGPFNVSTPAQLAARAAIDDMSHADASRDENTLELARVFQRLRGLGYDVTPSVCNFVLVHFPDTPGKSAKDADAALREHGVIVRAVGAYGLPHALRISIGRPAENNAVLDALEAFAGRA
jgi:histidinol-phosphate aminotransferase